MRSPSPAIELRQINGLEVYSAKPATPVHPVPLLFVHGAFGGGWVWADHYLAWFAARGYAAYALSLRGHAGSEGGEMLSFHSIGDYVNDVLSIAEWLGQAPVLIGHSMGGFIVQKFIERHPAAAAVLMCSPPPQGLFAAQFHLLVERPELFMDLNQLLRLHYANTSVIQEALFAQPVRENVLAAYLSRLQGESERALFDMTAFNLPLFFALPRPPMLVVGAEKDALVAAFIVQTTARSYGLGHHIFNGMGHALTHERGWQRVAKLISGWLEDNGF